MVSVSCAHTICKSCVEDGLKTCPVCRVNVEKWMPNFKFTPTAEITPAKENGGEEDEKARKIKRDCDDLVTLGLGRGKGQIYERISDAQALSMIRAQLKLDANDFVVLRDDDYQERFLNRGKIMMFNFLPRLVIRNESVRFRKKPSNNRMTFVSVTDESGKRITWQHSMPGGASMSEITSCFPLEDAESATEEMQTSKTRYPVKIKIETEQQRVIYNQLDNWIRDNIKNIASHPLEQYWNIVHNGELRCKIDWRGKRHPKMYHFKTRDSCERTDNIRDIQLRVPTLMKLELEGVHMTITGMICPVILITEMLFYAFPRKQRNEPNFYFPPNYDIAKDIEPVNAVEYSLVNKPLEDDEVEYLVF